MRDLEQLVLAVWFFGSIIGIYVFAIYQAIYNAHIHAELTTGTLQHRASWFALFFLVMVPFAWVAVVAAGALAIDAVALVIDVLRTYAR